MKRLGSVASMNDKCLSLKDKSRTSKAAKKKQKGQTDEEEEEGGCGKSSSKAKKKRGATTATKGCPFLDGDGLRELRDVALVSVISTALLSHATSCPHLGLCCVCGSHKCVMWRSWRAWGKTWVCVPTTVLARLLGWLRSVWSAAGLVLPLAKLTIVWCDLWQVGDADALFDAAACWRS